MGIGPEMLASMRMAFRSAAKFRFGQHKPTYRYQFRHLSRTTLGGEFW